MSDGKPVSTFPDIALARAASAHQYSNRLGDDQQVEPGREILDVEKVVMELAGRRLYLGDIALMHLRPAGDARAHDMAIGIEGYLALIPLGERDGLRPRADPAHFAAQDVDD